MHDQDCDIRLLWNNDENFDLDVDVDVEVDDDDDDDDADDDDDDDDDSDSNGKPPCFTPVLDLIINM
ncbi:hypothetical protein M0804_012015 [Polistes exclamans]|nr:hypothetical protein M0804_012015 [Polistes exclamans]